MSIPKAFSCPPLHTRSLTSNSNAAFAVGANSSGRAAVGAFREFFCRKFLRLRMLIITKRRAEKAYYSDNSTFDWHCNDMYDFGEWEVEAGIGILRIWCHNFDGPGGDCSLKDEVKF